MSRRDAKTAIRTLSDAERRRAARAVLDMRLKSFRYQNHPNASPTLGFIIEDNPDFPAIDASTNRVNLYTYASLLVAALQEQHQEIDRLRARIAQLEARAKASAGAPDPR